MTKQEHRIDRSLGCLLAGAAGDALGAPVEFLDRQQILSQFGPSGIRNYARAYGGIGKITDDTQMTLFTADGCLRAVLRYRTRGLCHPSSVIRNAYLRWLATQTARPLTDQDKNSWLMQRPELFSRRAPGNTCLSALSREGGERNDSKGCGGIMRVAPCGIIAANANKAFQLGSDAARLTHGHPTGYLAAGAFAAIIAQLMDRQDLHAAIRTARAVLVRHPGYDETLAAMDAAVDLAERRTDAATAIPALGEGWIAEEALAIALYCALVASSLEEGIILAVNITGDSDSTGAIAGNVLGAMYGVEAIPERWVRNLELRDAIETVAHDLVNIQEFRSDAEESVREDWVRRYPPN